MSINTINISKIFKLNTLIRLLSNNEPFDIACSKSGLTINDAKQLLDPNHLIKQ